MAPSQKRNVPSGQINTIGLVGITVGGVFMLGFFTVLILVFRERRKHERLNAELDQRGIVIAQAHKDAKRESITRPRAVLRRNSISQYNAKSGWGALTSTETINPAEPVTIPPHYAPPKPVGFVAKQKRLSWPFSARRASGRGIHMRKIRVPVLSTVIESPKPSPQVPVLSGPLGRQSSPDRKTNGRPSSDQSLLQHHPAFRFSEDDLRVDPLRRSITAKPVSKPDPLRSRSKSITELPMGNKKPALEGRLPRPKVHNRSASGNAPEGRLPPLPPDVARVKSETQRRSLVNHSPSRLSISSFESAGSSILATHPSPIMRIGSTRVQKVTKRDWRNSMIVGPRPLRDPFTLHSKNQPSQSSIKSSAARFSSVTASTQSEQQKPERWSSLPSMGRAQIADSGTMGRLSSPAASPYTARSFKTPKRKSGSFVTPYGSPEDRRKRSSMLHNASGTHDVLKRQLSQASTHASSTRSSNGNPFQWDPAPMSAGKPSNLKGSPSARRGHRRSTCVRISLTPTVLGPSSRSPSPGLMKDIQEEPPTATTGVNLDIGLGFSNTRSLPRPPSSSTFSPDVKFGATSIRASLTPSSPTLSMANYDHGPIGSPVISRNKTTSGMPRDGSDHRLSNGSIFCIPSFPSPCHSAPSVHNFASAPPAMALSQPFNECNDKYTSAGAPSPFELLRDNKPSPGRPVQTDEYDPERPYMVFQTPPAAPAPIRSFSSPFSTIPEESSARSCRTADYSQVRSVADDSPSCSPKTIPATTYGRDQEISALSLPDSTTLVPCDGTIDPALLSKEAFHSLNSPFDNRRGSINGAQTSTVDSTTILNSPGCAKSMFDPLIEAAFPSSPPTPGVYMEESLIAMYTLASSLPPISPRPRHAELPSATTTTPALNFSNIPELTPLPSGPRSAPSRPLRSSIQQLRRMNSDAEKGGRAEHMYLRLGREENLAHHGDESWLDDLDEPLTTNNSDTDNGGEDMDETWDEEKGRRLVGDLLNDWEQEATVLDLHDTNAARAMNPPSKSPSASIIAASAGVPGTSSPGTDGVEARERRAKRCSSIWEDGEKFWTSTPPFPPNSPNKPKQHFLPLSPSPTSFSSSTPLSPGKRGRKRDFEVAKDAPNSPRKSSEENEGTWDSKRNSLAAAAAAKGQRKSVQPLGVGTPNVRIHVHPPSSAAGTPGSLYDAEGFLT